MRLKHFCLIVICSCVFVPNAVAQGWEFGINAGASSYVGDLNPVNPAKISGINTGVFGRYNLDPYWSFGLYYNFGNIAADDSKSKDLYYQKRNLRFKTDLHELSAQATLHFFNYLPASEGKRLTPYLQAGFGIFSYNPKAKYVDNKYHNLRGLMTEGQSRSYSTYALALIYGAGVKYNANEIWSVFLQVMARTAFTDYLDDVSGTYPNESVFPYGSFGGLRKYFSDRSSPSNVPGTMRGDGRKNDYYIFAGLGITYTFVSQKCRL